MLALLKLHVLTYMPQAFLILLLDCARPHLTRATVQAAVDMGYAIVIIPALLTWLLQPLDTHAFQRYKAFMRKKYMLEKVTNGTGKVSVRKSGVNSARTSHVYVKLYIAYT